ncbi:MAG: pilus assembly protein TadG-related protein [Thermaerobacterales bacterium]
MRFLMKDERGSSMVLVAAAVAALLGFGALSIDSGRMYAERSHLQAVADAAALAGVWNLPDNPDTALSQAKSYLMMHGLDPEQAVLELSDDNTTLHISIGKTYPLVLGPVIGVPQAVVGVDARASTAHPMAVRGALPLGVEVGEFSLGSQYVLKVGSDSEVGPSKGNFHALALGGSGANNYRDNLEQGYPGWVEVAEEIPTEPGNMNGPTQQALGDRMTADPWSNYDDIRAGSPRLLLVPLVDSFDIAGKKEVRVVGLAMFFLEQVKGNGEVTGRFVRYNHSGGTSEWGSLTDYGVRVTQLVH